MSGLWSSVAGETPFGTQTVAPQAGGSAAARFQSVLAAAGKRGNAVAPPGLSPAASRAANAAGNPASAASEASSGSSNSDAVISANDFLTLLVTEMQNQDPTADVDPNAYINQLVQINSLEQLISINQNLSAVLGAATTPTGSTATNSNGAAAAATPKIGSVGSAASGQANGAASALMTAGKNGRASPVAQIGAARAASHPRTVHGNLGAPGSAPAANAVGRALNGHVGRAGAGHAIRDIPTRTLP